MLDNTFSPRRPVASEAEIKDAQNLVKACILTRKGGLPSSQLRDEFRNITDEEIPFFKLGYSSLFHFVRDIDEIRSGKNEKGEHVLVVKENSNNKHLIEMIKKQKDPKTVISKKRSRSHFAKRIQSRQDFYDNRRYDNSSSHNTSEPAEDEIGGPPIIHNYYFEEESISCTEPIVGKTQLIGDDYFLQLCIKYLDCKLWRKQPKSAITCGTVQSGLTIRKAIKQLDRFETMSNRLCINLGTVDVYNRRTGDQMIDDYIILLKKLTRKFGYSPNQITLCTLAPIGNLSIFANKDEYYNYIYFNKWLKTFCKKYNFKLLDLYEEFITEEKVIDYTYFQQDARNVSGTAHPHVLFNYFGRQKAMRLLLNL